ncbi:type II toxin-antitoxin system PemK/MazF family toxin [Psychrobacillus sp. L3]|uniref:type II toxin-antitoxin system PemK/MazF family toxin n=1 Tax=Psychrobacillus sp. L3 TaxID=3236891 RepID=UPI0036F4119D
MTTPMDKSGSKTIYNLDATIEKFKLSISTNLVYKKQQNMLEWLDTFSEYLTKESTFEPIQDTLKYEAGVILSVDLGFNAKSEHGGRHFAVVVEDNSKSSGTVVVIPLGSEKPDVNVNWNDVDLGVIEELNNLTEQKGVKSIAKISHIRSISKMRILQPVKKGTNLIYLEPDNLKKIYNKMKGRYIGKGLNRQPKKISAKDI